jgi:hypothetical protein
MDEAVLALLGSFVEVRRELGDAVYERVVERARLAVAAECMVEAERRALRHRRRHHCEGNVILLRSRLEAADGEP